MAENVGGGFDFLCLARFALALLQRAPDQIDRVTDVERLGQIFKRAALERGNGAFQIG